MLTSNRSISFVLFNVHLFKIFDKKILNTAHLFPYQFSLISSKVSDEQWEYIVVNYSYQEHVTLMAFLHFGRCGSLLQGNNYFSILRCYVFNNVKLAHKQPHSSKKVQHLFFSMDFITSIASIFNSFFNVCTAALKIRKPLSLTFYFTFSYK